MQCLQCASQNHSNGSSHIQIGHKKASSVTLQSEDRRQKILRVSSVTNGAPIRRKYEEKEHPSHEPGSAELIVHEHTCDALCTINSENYEICLQRGSIRPSLNGSFRLSLQTVHRTVCLTRQSCNYGLRATAQSCNNGPHYVRTQYNLRSPTASLRLSLREAHRASRATAQPLIAPIMTPLLKYFWMKG
ncbi:hypothetical protein BHAP_1798 [Bifidobacterium hapali]|uniref:Uncharacterized protein n=1 Tax=Bifidobacterium hapali TaxID=1630172 RepID=A0A261FWQ6_9BIFI|nr:hypothetical protein BHAP_1798 [Bifidobacterium hapali]